MASFKKRSFKPLDQKRVKEGASRTGSRFDSIFKQDVKTLKLTEGVNNLRILRGPDDTYWNETIHVHSYVGAKKSTYLCPRMMGKSKRCPICDASNEAAEAGDKEEAGTLSVKDRHITYVINRDDEKQGLQVWDMSWSQARDIDATSDTKRGVLDISHPDEGFDIQISRQGKGLNTRYVGLQIDRESSPLSDDARQQDAWLEEATNKPLSSLLKFYPEDYLADILSGKVEEKDEEDDEDEADARSNSKRKRGDDADEEEDQPRGRGSRRSSADAEDDDKPWDDDDKPAARARSSRGRDEEVDEEEERPARGKRNGRARDEEEEEDKPRSRSRSRSDEDEDVAEEAEAKRWKRGKRDAEEEEEQPASRKRRDEDEEEERPRRRASREDDEPDDADEKPSRKRNGRAHEEDEDKPRTRSRERVRDDDDEEDKPRRGSRARDDDEEEEGRTVRRRSR
jgi:hypothetical protein